MADRFRVSRPLSARLWSGALASLALGAAILTVAAAPAHAETRLTETPRGNPTAVSRDVEALVRDARLGSAKVGVSIVDLSGNTRLAQVGADTRLIPASNMKVLTTGAALAVLGVDYTFRTELLLQDDILILKGSGDPALGDPEFLKGVSKDLTTEHLLTAMVKAVKDANVTSIREIIVDDRIFDRQFVHARWPLDQLDRHYCAGVAGLNFHRNVLDFFTRPAPDGASAPAFTLQPAAPWIAREVRISARTVNTGKHTAWIRRDGKLNRFSLLGDVRYEAQAPVRVALHEAPIFTGQLLADRLLGAGIRIGTPEASGVAAVRLAETGERFDQARAIALITTPLADVVTLCNVDSVNLYAEALIKLLGHVVSGEPGSWETGGSVVRMVLTERLGPSAAQQIIVSDGSGMSRDNQVTPSLMTAFLASMYNDKALAEPFLASLAEAGDGTLRKRFRNVKLDNEIRAKSGYLNGVRTLSGYVVNRPTGRAVAFSILINDLSGSGATDSRALQLHEAIVARVDQYLTEVAGATASASP